MCEFEVHAVDATIQESDGTAERRGDGGRSKFAGFREHAVVVDELMLRGREAEEESEASVDHNVLRLPHGFVSGNVTDLVEWGGALDEGVGGEEAVNFDEEASGGGAVEIEGADGVGAGVTDEEGGGVGRWRDGGDVLVGIHGEVDFGVDRVRSAQDGLR